MDTKFQTSFIPKKPLFVDQKIIRQSGGTSVFMLVAIIIFILSVAGAGLAFVYEQVLVKNQESYRASLKKTEAKFDVALINKLENANKKIDLGKQLLKNHIATSEVFNIINLLTTEGIRFNSFEFSGPFAGQGSALAGNNDVKIIMKGVGKNFSAVAWQSDVFGQSEKYAEKYGGKKIIKNPIISDLTLDPKGDVGFTFTAYVDPSDVSYEKVITSNQ
ncbi:MAG: hypothetical protein Q7S72_01565 [Candidatus Taylorbacteria bacterium]|nr:hypothetical protein [Candidatus Taylorbacteria bacterium]